MNASLFNSDIKVLLKEASKLNLGETKEGTLYDYVVENGSSNSKIIAHFSEDKKNADAQIIDIRGFYNGNDENNKHTIKGNANIARFSKGNSYLIKRDFLDVIGHIPEYLKLNMLNREMPGMEFHFDKLGRVFFYGVTGNIYYINSTKTGCINQAGEYGDLIKDERGYLVDLILNSHVDDFDYLYIIPEKYNIMENNDIKHL